MGIECGGFRVDEKAKTLGPVSSLPESVPYWENVLHNDKCSYEILSAQRVRKMMNGIPRSEARRKSLLLASCLSSLVSI